MLTTYSAKNAMVRAGIGTVFPVKKWTTLPKTDKNDTSNSEGGGFTENGSAGLYSCEFTLELDDNALVAYYVLSFLSPGVHIDVLGNLFLYLNGVSGPFWRFPSYFIEQSPETADVRQNMGLVISGCNHGPFFYPQSAAGSTT